MRLLQINLNHCKAAQELLRQTVYEKKVDVAIICEQYKNLCLGTWVEDLTGKVAVWACGNKTYQDRPLGNRKYYTMTKIRGVHIYSCYVPPSISQVEYEQILDNLVRDGHTTTPNIIAGNFNAGAME